MMVEIWIIFLAVFIFVSFADYLYVNVGEYFQDQYKNVYMVIEKNPLWVKLANDCGQKTIPIMVLCMRWMKVDMTDF
jgi:hypothetical protein